MLNRTDYPIDIQPGPWPSSGLIGFSKAPEDEAYQPVYRVTKAEWEELPGFWIRRRSMRKLEVIETRLHELKQIANEVVEDRCGDYTPKLKAQAFDVCAAIDTAIQACREPQTAKAPF